MDNKEQIQTKKGFLDEIYYKKNKQRDFFVCGTYEKDGEKRFTKWKKYLDCVAIIDVVNWDNDWKDRTYFEQINQRQILPNEIVLDIEDPTQLKPILQKIRDFGWDENEIIVFETGSRGYHVHLFGDKDMNEKEKEAIVGRLGADIQKCSEKNLIALENVPHWKTGRLKLEVNV